MSVLHGCTSCLSAMWHIQRRSARNSLSLSVSPVTLSVSLSVSLSLLSVSFCRSQLLSVSVCFSLSLFPPFLSSLPPSPLPSLSPRPLPLFFLLGHARRAIKRLDALFAWTVLLLLTFIDIAFSSATVMVLEHLPATVTYRTVRTLCL